MLLAIDVGNTQLKAGLWEREWEGVARGPVPTSAPEAKALLEKLDGIQLSAAICASVVPSANDVVQEAVRNRFGTTVTFLSAELPLGVTLRYASPHTLGMDRLANVLGVLATTYEGIVVDAGTATKIEAVKNGEYMGGAILPGLSMGARSLAGGTAQLPEVELTAPKHAIGTDTSSAIRSGLLLGHGAAVDGMVKRFAEELGRLEIAVFVTGGHANLLLEVCGTPMRLEPQLTLDGLVEGARRLGLWRSA